MAVLGLKIQSAPLVQMANISLLGPTPAWLLAQTTLPTTSQTETTASNATVSVRRAQEDRATTASPALQGRKKLSAPLKQIPNTAHPPVLLAPTPMALSAEVSESGFLRLLFQLLILHQWL